MAFSAFSNGSAMGLFCVRTLKAGITSRYQIKELFRQMDEIGSKSIALVILTGNPSEKFVYSSEDLFDKDKTGKIKEKNSLKDAGKFLEKNPFGFIVVTAYTVEPIFFL